MYQVPPAVNYPNPLVALVARYLNPPREGNRMIPVEIDWGTMGGASHCVAINLQNNATLEFSQIIALAVDNSDCGADVRFVFPDTGETTTIPAGSPKTIIEVFTNQVQFFVVAGFNSETVLANDSTRFSIHNSLPPPISVPISVEQESAVFNAINADGATMTQLVPATVSGTLQGIQVLRTSPFANSGAQAFLIKDGTGKVITGGTFDSDSGTVSFDAIILDLNPMNVRFSQGLQMLQSGVNVGGKYCVNLLFRIP